ncbi:type II CAAX prenyl endopeptidase Rce1 family protein [Undibacterium sp.]|uniref:CPBP family glutamic-type intramembrane protease n=1 Tax=Undibacterium sp. TaxID=1914977 RepID=UPI00374DF0D5
MNFPEVKLLTLIKIMMINQLALAGITGISRRVHKRPLVGASMLGVGLGIVCALTALLLIGAMILLLPKELWGKSAAASTLNGLGSTGLFFLGVVFVPFLETFMGQVLPIELARRFRANKLSCILLSAVIFGGGHYLNGGLAHAISTFCIALIFAGGYMAVRLEGFWPAFLVAYIAHATSNALLLFVFDPLFPGLQ